MRSIHALPPPPAPPPCPPADPSQPRIPFSRQLIYALLLAAFAKKELKLPSKIAQALEVLGDPQQLPSTGRAIFLELDAFFCSAAFASLTYHQLPSLLRQKPPSFFQKCRKFYARMTTKSEGWLVSALQENEEGPKEKYVKFLVNKAHEKHEKIDKFFQIVFQFRHKINDNTVMNLKILNLLHIYL